GGQISEIPDLVVAGNPITAPDLQLVHQIVDRPKIFLAGYPTHREGWENTKFVVGAKSGGTVTPHNAREQVLFLITVVQSRKEGDDLVGHPGIRIGHDVFGGDVKVEGSFLVIVHRNIVVGDRFPLGDIIQIDSVAQEGREIMPSEAFGIGGRIFNVPSKTLVRVPGNAVLGGDE